MDYNSLPTPAAQHLAAVMAAYVAPKRVPVAAPWSISLSTRLRWAAAQHSTGHAA